MHNPASIGKPRETDDPAPSQPPPCGTRRRSAVAIVSTARQSGITESGPHAGNLAVATTKTQRAGASPRPPSDSTLLTSPRRRHTRGPRHVRLSTPCHGSVYCIAVRIMKSVALFPRFPSKQLNHTRRSTASRCTTRADSFHLHDKKPPELSLAPSFDDERH